MALNFLVESAKDFQETPTVGGFGMGRTTNSFDSLFESVESQMLEKGYDVKRDITQLIANESVMDAYKTRVLSSLAEDADADQTGHAMRCYESVEQLWDNCVTDFVKESQSVASLLPIKAIDLPILVKQHLKAATKDIMQTEVVKSPIIKKHIQRTFIVDPKTGKSWEYPRCFFDGTYTEFFEAGKGLPIKDDAVTLPQMNYDVIENLTDGTKGHDRLSYNIEISKIIDADGNEYAVKRPITADMATGALVFGDVEFTTPKASESASGSPTLTEETTYKDKITGSIDFAGGTISISSCAGNVKKVKLSGYLSNENNERGVSMEYRREQREWKIEDGFRMNVSYSMEQLEDAKALLDVDLYKQTYNNLTDVQVQVEDSGILDYLDREYDRYNGVAVDVLGYDSFVKNPTFDCNHASYNTVALRCEYIEKELKFQIDRTLIDLADTAKIENMTFVIYGNPRYISLLGKNVQWVVRSGDSLGGVRLDYSYGIMNSGDIKVQVVSAAKIPAKRGSEVNNSLRIIPFPLDPEIMTFKHYKWSTHIMTTANSGYRDPNLPGGSMTNLCAFNRNKTVSVQGIQAKLTLENSTFVG